MEGCDGMRRAALRDDIASAAFALTALGGHTEFKLHLVETHPGAHVPCDFSVRDPAANANDHGGDGSWLAGL
jgi:hypothetical protein